MASPTKRQELPAAAGGALVLIATPIGNLGDLTPRARDALAAAHAVAAEDTRRAQALFSALGLARPPGGFVRADAHAERGAGAEEVLARLARGERVAFVTDAGTPGVADPGAELVRRARAAGYAIEALPGASALALAQSLSGFASTALEFVGFLPRDEAGRDALAEALGEPAAARRATWAFESAQRVTESLARLAERAPAGTRAFAAKELTKIHERHFHGTLAEVSAAVSSEIAREGARGEWVVGWEPGSATGQPAPGDEAEGAKPVWNESLADCAAALLRAGARPAEAARALSQIFGCDRREVYREISRLAR